MAFLVRMVVDGGMICDEFLQVSHTSEALHPSFLSSKWQVRILYPIVQTAAHFLSVNVTNYLHRGAVGSKLDAYLSDVNARIVFL